MDEPLVCPVVLPSAMLGSYVRDGEALTASKRETGPKMRYPVPRPWTGGEDPRETSGWIGGPWASRKGWSESVLIGQNRSSSEVVKALCRGWIWILSVRRARRVDPFPFRTRSSPSGTLPLLVPSGAGRRRPCRQSFCTPPLLRRGVFTSRDRRRAFLHPAGG